MKKKPKKKPVVRSQKKKKPIKKSVPAKRVEPKAPEPAPVLGTTKISKKKLEDFRKILNDWRDSLIREALASMGGMTEVAVAHPDLTDQASAEIERDFLLRIKDRERKLILKIKEALSRIDNATFGVCDICGDQISEERLRARPVTTQCIECKTDMEDHERRMSSFG